MGRRHRRNRRGARALLEGAIFRLTTKLLLAVIVIAIFLSAIQCTIKSPEAPSWNTTLNIPLLNQTYGMPEIIRRIDEPTLSLDSVGDPRFNYTNVVDSIGVNAERTIAPISERTMHVVGLIEISPGTVAPTQKTFDQLFTGGPVVPSMNVTFVYDPAPLTSFSSVSVENGWSDVIITNNLGVVLDQVTVDLFDLTTFVVVGTASAIGSIAVGESDTLSISLGGKTISNTLRFQVVAHTPGGVVLSSAGKNLDLEVSLTSPMTINAGTSKIGAIDKLTTTSITAQQEHLLDTAHIIAGTLAFTFVNATAMPVTLSVVVAEFMKNGQPLTIQHLASPGSQFVSQFDLAGYTVQPLDRTLPQTLDIATSAHIDSSGGQFVTVRSTDSMVVSVVSSALTLGAVTAAFAPVVEPIAPAQVTLDVPTGFDSAQLSGAVMTLEIDNGSGLPGDLSITLSGSNGKTLNISGPISSGSVTAPVTSYLTETDLASFLNPIPVWLSFAGQATLGDGSTVATVNGEEFVRARVRIESPLEVLFSGSTVRTDVSGSNMDTADVRIVTDHLNSAVIEIAITNRLPIAVDATLLFSADSASLYSAPQLTLGPITLPPAPVDVFGDAIDSTVSITTIAIDSADAAVFNAVRVFSGQLLSLASSGGQPVRLRGDDYIHIRANISADYNFNGSF